MSFDVEDILNEIKQKEKNKSEVTAYLDRYFLDGMIKEYYESIKGSKDTIYTTNLVDIREYNFTGADFRGIPAQDFAIFDFTYTDISYALIDRAGLENFIPYIKDKKITYLNLILDGSNLGPKIYKNPKMGIYCKIFLNLEDLDLSGISFKNCNMMDVIFKGAILNGCNFIGSKNLNPKSFKNSIDFENAKFFESQDLDEQFKQQIIECPSSDNFTKTIPENSLFFKIAYLLDLKNTKRFDE